MLVWFYDHGKLLYISKSIALHCAGTVDSKTLIVQQDNKKNKCKKKVTVFIINKIIKIFMYHLTQFIGLKVQNKCSF